MAMKEIFIGRHLNLSADFHHATEKNNHLLVNIHPFMLAMSPKSSIFVGS